MAHRAPEPELRADVLIVGGGPAGLSAALVLGRCRRDVVLFDDGQPRNACSAGVHGFFTRDGAPPDELLRIGREQLARYGVRTHAIAVASACPEPPGFAVTTTDGRRYVGRKLLLATGITDDVPDIPGLAPLYGRSVFHCPHCDGWEVRDRALAVHGRGIAGVRFALALTVWSRDILLCTDGAPRLSHAARVQLEAHDIALRSEKIVRVEADGGALRRIVFEHGPPEARDALFFFAGTRQRSPIVADFGCKFTRKGAVKTGDFEEAGLYGLYVAGDASEDVNFVAVAAAEGVKAGVAINKAMREEDSRARVRAYYTNYAKRTRARVEPRADAGRRQRLLDRARGAR